MSRLVIIGASGHGEVVADIAALNGYEDIVFLDDNASIKECAGYPVVGKTSEAPEGAVFVAIGSSDVRKRLMKQYHDREQPKLIHPSAVVAKGTEIGEGSVVVAGVVINPGARIGRGVIVNTGSSIDHDCGVGNYSHVAVGVRLCGTVYIGEGTWIGAGATVINNVNVCDSCVIGAGSVVIRDIVRPGTYAGTPARMVSYEE